MKEKLTRYVLALEIIIICIFHGVKLANSTSPSKDQATKFSYINKVAPQQNFINTFLFK